MNNEIADLQWDRDRHIAANAVLKAEIERRGERIAALEELLATTRARWAEAQAELARVQDFLCKTTGER